MIDLEVIRLEKERELPVRQLSEYGELAISFPAIPFAPGMVETVRELGGDVDWVPAGVSFRLLVQQGFGPISAEWWGRVEFDEDFDGRPTTVGKWVLWLPGILEGSTYKSREEQQTLLPSFARRLGVPMDWVVLGSVLELAYLFLLHYQRTNQMIAPWARSTTPYGPKCTLGVGFNFTDNTLVAPYWLHEARSSALGICPLVDFNAGQ